MDKINKPTRQKPLNDTAMINWLIFKLSQEEPLEMYERQYLISYLANSVSPKKVKKSHK